MRRALPSALVPESWHREPVVGIIVCHTGHPSRVERDLRPLHGLGRPIADTVAPRRYVEQQSLFDATQPHGLCQYWKSEFYADLSDTMLAACRQHAAAIESPMSQLILFQLGGAVGDRDPTTAAFGHRDAKHVLFVAGTWSCEAPRGDRHRAWVRAAWEALRTYSTGGNYINAQTADEDDVRTREAYGGSLALLASTKRVYDPENLFRVNRNIPPRSNAADPDRGGAYSPSMTHARAPDGTRIAYEVHGTGARALVFIHAWGVSGSYFDEAVSTLDLTAVRAITLDLRGHGDSDKPDVELTWDLLASDVLAVADAVGAGTFVTVGHSLGGKLAQYLPLVQPDRLDALVLVASPSAGRLPTPEFVREWVELAGDGDALVRDSVRRFLRGPVPEAALRRIARDAAKIPRRYLERTLDLVATTSFVERLGDVRIPVLVLSAADDPVHTTERDILTSFPLARIETMASGSEIPLEHPAEFAQVVERFLAELAQSPRRYSPETGP